MMQGASRYSAIVMTVFQSQVQQICIDCRFKPTNNSQCWGTDFEVNNGSHISAIHGAQISGRAASGDLCLPASLSAGVVALGNEVHGKI